MPPRKETPQSYEPSLEGMRPEVDLERRNAFGRAVSLSYYDISPVTLEGLSTDDLALVSTLSLTEALYTGGGDFKIDGLTFNETEYSTIARSPRALGKAVMATTQTANMLDHNQDRRDGRVERSRLHAFESKEEAMSKLMDGLGQEKDWLDKLFKEMRSPGFAHFKEGEMRLLINNTWQISFKNILSVASTKNGWDGETHETAERALTKKLLTGEQRTKVGYWQQMTSLARRYNRNKQSIINTRLNEVRKSLV